MQHHHRIVDLALGIAARGAQRGYVHPEVKRLTADEGEAGQHDVALG